MSKKFILALLFLIPLLCSKFKPSTYCPGLALTLEKDVLEEYQCCSYCCGLKCESYTLLDRDKKNCQCYSTVGYINKSCTNLVCSSLLNSPL